MSCTLLPRSGGPAPNSASARRHLGALGAGMLTNRAFCLARPSAALLPRLIISSVAFVGLGAPTPAPGACPAPNRSAAARCSASSAAASLHSMAAPETPPRALAVLDFWFGEGWAAAPPGDRRPHKAPIWYSGGAELDAQVISLFGADCEALLAGEYDGWAAQPLPALAGIILGDQLFRNAFRGTAKMYAADPKVLAWAKALMASGADKELKPIQRVFVYMTLMHSEELADQEECIARFEGLLQECEAAGYPEMVSMAQNNIKYAKAHAEVVRQWGRFPHRNAILGRESTPEEAAGIAAGTIAKW